MRGESRFTMTETVCITEASADGIVAATAASGAVACRFHPDSARQEMLSLWRALEERFAPAPLMCTADWTETWLHHFGRIVPHRFAVLSEGDSPFAVALVTQSSCERDGLAPIRALHVGTSGEPDEHSACVEYNAVLCDPRRRMLAWNALVESLDREPSWDELRLDGFAASELGELLDDPRWCWIRKPSRFVDCSAIRRSHCELISCLGGSTRKIIRQNLRHYGDVAVEWATDVNHAHDIFAELMVLHQARWRAEGKPGCYSSPIFTAFHRELLERFVPQGRMALFRVRAGGTTLGCSQLLIDRGRVLLYQGGRQFGDQKHSPGLVTDYLAIQESLLRGYVDFDFMAGESVHKQRLTTHSADLVWGVRRRPRLKFAVMGRLRQIKHWLRSIQGEN